VLILGGPWEFKKSGTAAPEQTILRSLARAFDQVDYDLIVLSGEEAQLFSKHGLALQAGVVSNGSGQVEIFSTAVGRVAVITLPPLDGNFVMPNHGMIETVRALSASARTGADLVVAISPWGAQGERFLLEKSAPDIDILLGSGPGPGVPGQITNRAQTLWARPYDKGQTVTSIVIKLPLGSPGSHKWVSGANVESKPVPLIQSVPEDESTRIILSDLP
jgi:hypothetical protein